MLCPVKCYIKISSQHSSMDCSYWLIESSPREVERKEECDRLRGPNSYLNWPQVKQISSCQQAKYDKFILLKAAHHPTTL